MIAYHIDRKNILFEGQKIKLSQDTVINSKIDLSSVVTSNYPDGLSQHGIHYYTSAYNYNNLDPMLDFLRENILEYERRVHFPNLLSRFQSFFAVENMNKVSILRDSWNLVDDSFQVCQIEYDKRNSLSLDCSWIDFITPHSFLLNHYYANKYWTGEISNNPNMEILIKPPIKIMKCL